MKKLWIGHLVVFLLCMTALAQSQGAAYQSGKVVAVEKIGASGHASGGTDAPLKSETHSYNVSVQIGDTIYVCRYHEQTGELASWLQDKDVQVIVKGKVLHMKRATGKDAKMSVLRTTKAAQP